ncbi:hypothetical protein J7E79_00170 [Bacillus sp. ISL-40]|uniref:UPF0158 family protein n=1 Tax=unclassified Bacillus (in: firmicutes) TaxID=185979 RepID=UPI001BE9E558|nr:MULTISPECIES: UPF0158 family protein [unclassified Bacillus (in: firmicutes)]MBT2695863.1 hypothetical protein [Bacillus sp. ISL-40]MBT2743867.1 hypothetical protein [Bacillus sp. ISL-77]
MTIQVKLKDIIEEMEIQFEESHSLLNIKTGEIVLVTSEDLREVEDEKPFDHLPEWEQENRMIAIDVVENFENYIELPTKYEVNEYEIMEDFCLTVSDQRKQDSLLRAIKGKGAFRRFKDKIIDFELEEQWYSYRDENFKQIAIEWCQENKINFIE